MAMVVSTRPLDCFRDVTDQLDLMQSDLDHMREVLSSGQYSLDPSILAGVGLLQALAFCVETLLCFVTMLWKIRGGGIF